MAFCCRFLRVSTPLTACLTGCGIVTSIMGILTMHVFAPMAATTYVSDFTKYQMTTHSVKCIDSTNKGNYYEIPIPTATLTTPPTSNQTIIPTLSLVDNLFIRPPYYEIHVYMSTLTNPEVSNVIYSLKYKFMNQCSELAENLVRRFIWNGTQGYVYIRGSDTYPFAFPKYDILIPYIIGIGVMLLGVMFCICAYCSGISGCPLNTWISGRRVGRVQNSGTSSSW